jgi:hypothetical protein
MKLFCNDPSPGQWTIQDSFIERILAEPVFYLLVTRTRPPSLGRNNWESHMLFWDEVTIQVEET